MAKSPGIRLSSNLTLPLDIVTETIAILARRGAGKTFAASVLCEEIINAGLPAVIIDPLGVWWGLRASADGEGDGLPIVIFGGDHADVPLDENSGELIADVIVSENISAIIDVSLLSKSSARRFLAKFIARIYHRSRTPRHIVIDEADAFAPQQRQSNDGQALLTAVEDLVRRGRVRGLGTTLITQRPAVLHKDVLTQAGILFAMRMSGPRDVTAIDEWVRLHAEEGQAKEVKDSLPSLPVGTGWIWAPGYPQELVKIKVRQRTTFDSSSTPKVGQVVIEPRRMAPVDIAALGDRIATAAQEVAKNDPDALKAEIRRLEQSLAARPSAKVAPKIETVTVTEQVEVEVPVITGEQEILLKDLSSLAEQVTGLMGRFNDGVETLTETVRAATGAKVAPTTPRAAATRPATSAAATPRSRPSAPASLPAPAARQTSTDLDDPPPLRAGARRIVDAIAANHPRRLTKSQVGTLAKLRTNSGTFSTYMGDIRRRGLLDETGAGFGLTEAGLAEAGVEPGAGMSTEQLREQYRNSLRAGARKIFDHLLAIYPESQDKTEVAEIVGLTANSGTYSTYVGDLKRNGLATVENRQLRATDILFE